MKKKICVFLTICLIFDLLFCISVSAAEPSSEKTDINIAAVAYRWYQDEDYCNGAALAVEKMSESNDKYNFNLVALSDYIESENSEVLYQDDIDREFLIYNCLYDLIAVGKIDALSCFSSYSLAKLFDDFGIAEKLGMCISVNNVEDFADSCENAENIIISSFSEAAFISTFLNYDHTDSIHELAIICDEDSIQDSISDIAGTLAWFDDIEVADRVEPVVILEQSGQLADRWKKAEVDCILVNVSNDAMLDSKMIEFLSNFPDIPIIILSYDFPELSEYFSDSLDNSDDMNIIFFNGCELAEFLDVKKDLEEEYTDKFDMPMDFYAAVGYINTKILCDAIILSQNTESFPEYLLDEYQFSPDSGELFFDSKNNLLLSYDVYKEIFN